MQLGSLRLRPREDPASLRSPLLRGWAAKGHTLSLDIGSRLAKAATFPDFLHMHCLDLRTVHASSSYTSEQQPGQEVAHFAVAAAAMPGLQELFCEGFMPTGLPTSLARLSICPAMRGPLALESLFAKLELLPHLSEVTLTLRGSNILLRAEHLPNLELRLLKRIFLDITHLTDETVLDISALGSPERSFQLWVTLAPHDQTGACFYWQEPLQHLRSVLQPRDIETAGRGGLSASEQTGSRGCSTSPESWGDDTSSDRWLPSKSRAKCRLLLAPRLAMMKGGDRPGSERWQNCLW